MAKMRNSFFDLGIPENIPVRDLVWDYCKVEIENKNLDTIFDDLKNSYLSRINNLQPTYAQFTSYRLYLRYRYFKKKILELPHWPSIEMEYWSQTELFKLK